LRPDPRDQGPGRSSPGVRFLFRAGPRLGCPCSGLASNRLRGPTRPSEPGIASPGVLAPSSALTPGAPWRVHQSLAAPAERVKVARPSPVPSSGFLPLSTVLAALAARTSSLRSPPSPCAPTLRGLVSCRSRPLESSYRAFPSRGAVPALAGPCFLAGSRSTAQRRGTVRDVRDPFRLSRRPRATAGLAARWTGWPGRRFPGVTRAARVTGCPARVRHSFSDRTGLAGLGDRHARFEALLTSRVRSRDDPSLARDGGPPRSVLSWTIPL